MRLQYIVGIIIGVLLIYLGFMGSAGLGLTLSWSSPTLPTREDFNDLGGWLTYQDGWAINPAGQLQLQAPETGINPRVSVTSTGALLGTTTDYTLTIYMKVDAWSSSGSIIFQLYSTTLFTTVEVLKTGLKSYTATTVTPYTNNNEWHKYTVVCTGKTTWEVYVDTQKVLSFAQSFSGSFQQRLSLDAFNGILVHIDWITVEEGAHPPGGTPPPPSTVALTIDAAWYDGSTKILISDVSITVGGVAKTVPATWSSLQKGNVQLVAPTSFTRGTDTYTFLQWSDSNTAASRSYDLQSDTSLTAVYKKNGEGDPNPPDDGGDILTNMLNALKKVLNNPQVQQIEVIIGGLTTLICGIMFILPTKRYGQPAPPSYF